MIVETMGLEPTTPCLQSNAGAARRHGGMAADQGKHVHLMCGRMPLVTVVDRCYWHANGTDLTTVARK